MGEINGLVLNSLIEHQEIISMSQKLVYYTGVLNVDINTMVLCVSNQTIHRLHCSIMWCH